MELSQKYLPLGKRFALVVSHNKWLMTKNTLLEQELASHVALKAKYDDLKWQFEKFKEENKKPPVPQKKKHKIAIKILKSHRLFQKYLNEIRG